MANERPILEVVNTDGHKRTYYKCMREGCNAKASKEFCPAHSKKLNKCSYPNCTRNSRGERCHLHHVRALENAKVRAARARERQREARRVGNDGRRVDQPDGAGVNQEGRGTN